MDQSNDKSVNQSNLVIKIETIFCFAICKVFFFFIIINLFKIGSVVLIMIMVFGCLFVSFYCKLINDIKQYEFYSAASSSSCIRCLFFYKSKSNRI